jgi:transposase
MYVQRIKIENREQRYAMKFLFLQETRSKAIHGKLSEVLEEAAVSLATVKRWRQRVKDGNLSHDDEFGSGRPRSDIGEAISQFLSREPFLFARGLKNRLASRSCTIKKVLTGYSGMRKFIRS